MLAHEPAEEPGSHLDEVGGRVLGLREVFAEGDRVAVRFRLTGTNTQPFMNSPPSERAIDVEALALMKIASGRVAELRGQFDQMAVLQQIGAVSA